MQKVWSILFFASPLIVGAIVTLAKPVAVVSWVDKLNSWLLEKRTKIAEKTGYVSRYFLMPLLWGLTKIMDWTEKVDNQFLRCGIRITAYLYFMAIMLYLALIATIFIIVIALTVVALWIVLWIWSLLEGGEESPEKGKTPGAPQYAKAIDQERFSLSHVVNPFVGSGMDKLKDKFGDDFGELREDGSIYSKDIISSKIGYIDNEGKIYRIDKSGILPSEEKIGRVDEEGNVWDD